MSRNTAVKQVFRRSALTFALGMCISSVAMAQSNAAGSIFGSAAQPGSTVVIENVDTGLTRTLQVDGSGRFSATSLPTGQYRVTLQRNGQAVATRENVEVQIGSGSEVNFAANADTLDTVVVSGTRASTI
ncbi:MAG: carboxypeptidase regulatory-like domain-containing protein, partial [Lysobacter sp.]